MPKLTRILRLGVVAAALASIIRAEPSFTGDVLPILQRSCQGCHQPANTMSGLDVTTFAALRVGGKKGSPLAPGDPEASLLYTYVTGKQQPQMPLGQPPLPEDQIAILRDWITAGAPDDTPAETTSTEPPTYQQAPVVPALAFSPDGEILAVAGYREVVLHSADGSQLLARLVGGADKILSLAFTPDGKTLLAAGGTPSRYGEVQLWDVASHSLTRTVRACGDTIFGASISPSGDRFAFGCPDQTTRIYDLATGDEIHKSSYHENWVLGTVFDRDGERLVSVGRDRAARVADTETGAFLETVNKLRGELSALALHPTRDAILIGGEDRIPFFYEMQRTKKMNIADDTTLIREFERQQGEIFALAFDPDGQRAAVAGASPEVPLYDVETGERTATLSGHSAGIYTVAFSPGGEHVATAGFDGQVRLYDADTGDLLKEFTPVPLAGGS